MRSRTARLSAVAVGLVLAVLIGVLAFSDSAGERTGPSPLVGLPSRELAGSTVVGGDGGRYDLAGDEGRFVLVNFFATWCVPCRLEHDDLKAFAAANPDEVQVVSVVLSDTAEAVRAFFDEEGGDWPVVDDPDGAIANRWGVLQPPESYLVGPEGVVRNKIIGGADFGSLQRLLAAERAR